ncbi:MAG: YaiI/YqxD family protein [Clostridiales bacterium]|nr:YaiI/YqxD family protein [Clostridiales bacterium]
MQIFIDADGCPVVDLTIKIAKSHNLPCTIICDTSHIFEKEGIETITVEKGADSVDFKLVNLIKENDIAVTQDYGLAAMCLSKRAVPINQNGLVFTEENIDGLLFSRYLGKKLRSSGERIKGPSKRTKEQDKSFEKNLIRLIGDLNV